MSSSEKNPKSMGWGGIPQYHESAEEVDRIRRRKEIRQKLKAEFNRLYYNPYKAVAHVEILDPGVQRFMSMRASMYEYWKPSWKSFFAYFSITFAPIWLYGYYVNKKRAEYDQKCRTGEIPYHERRVKMC